VFAAGLPKQSAKEAAAALPDSASIPLLTPLDDLNRVPRAAVGLI
jgi:hypothetical protein